MIYLYLFLEFFKIGLFTFGGGYAMIPLVKEVVLQRGWLAENDFYNFIGVCESTPGPIAINMATFIGSEQGGLLGSVIATFAVILPSFIIILLIASLMSKFIKNKYVQAFLKGVKPVVIALILSTGLLLLIKAIGYNSIGNFSFDLQSLICFVLIVLMYFSVKFFAKKKINNILLICMSAIIGLVVCMIL